MKFITIITISLLFQNPLFAQKELHFFSLSAYVKGKDSSDVYLNYIANNKMGLTDSCKSRKGHFEFKGEMSESTKAWFRGFSDNESFDVRI